MYPAAAGSLAVLPKPSTRSARFEAAPSRYLVVEAP
jgi:hypothetical protein